jgi:hypothetical protein
MRQQVNVYQREAVSQEYYAVVLLVPLAQTEGYSVILNDWLQCLIN